MSIRFTPAILLAVLAGCGPSGANMATGSSPSPSQAPTATSSASVTTALPSVPAVSGPTGTIAYTKGSLKVDGTAVTLPPYFMVVKTDVGTAKTRAFNQIGLTPDAKMGDWAYSIQYGHDGANHSVIATLVQRTTDKPSDVQTFGFTLMDAGTGKTLYIPAVATGTYKEHDGMVDITFSGALPGVPAATKQFEGNFPDLPLQ